MKSQRILIFACLAAVTGAAGCSGNKTPVASAAAPATKTAAQPSADSDQDLMISGPIVVENQIDLAAQRDGVVSRIVADNRNHGPKRTNYLPRWTTAQLFAERQAADARASPLPPM